MGIVYWFSKFSSRSKNTSDLFTCFDILGTEHAGQKLNTKTAETYFLHEAEGKSGSALRIS
jgi:hypothetical protein